VDENISATDAAQEDQQNAAVVLLDGLRVASNKCADRFLDGTRVDVRYLFTSFSSPEIYSDS
jgi:hypothetical protein